MITVKLTTPFPQIPIERQTPNSSGVWGNYRFIINQPTEQADWWVVLENVPSLERTICPRENTILITHEVYEMKQYNQKFLNQFSTIVTSQREIKHPHVLHKQQGYLWHVGWFGRGSGVDPKDFKKVFTTYDQLASITNIQKEKSLSVITSNKSRTEGQALRHEFIRKMKDHFSERFDVFGAGVNMIRDKWEGIAPYKYHFALENNAVPDYWTEKLADAYLAGAYPIYYGCPNIHDYFPENALTVIDITDIQGSIEKIEKVLSENYYEKYKTEIWKARDLILNKYNFFAMIATTLDTLPSGTDTRIITIRPEKKPQLFKKTVSVLKTDHRLYTLFQKIYRTYRNMRYKK